MRIKWSQASGSVKVAKVWANLPENPDFLGFRECITRWSFFTSPIWHPGNIHLFPWKNSTLESPMVRGFRGPVLRCQGHRCSRTAAWDRCQPIHSISKSNSQRLSFNVPRWVPSSGHEVSRQPRRAETWPKKHLGW